MGAFRVPGRRDLTLRDGEAIAGGKKISYGALINKHFADSGGEFGRDRLRT